MSQAGVVDFEGSHPQVPTSFVTDIGTAVPIGNVLEIHALTVAAHGIPLETTGAGNVVDIIAQYASSSVTSIAGNSGFASFNSGEFTVDANGYVSLLTTNSESIMVDTFTSPGTNPVTPNGSGIITVTGGQVAAGTTTNVIRTDSLAANSYTIQVQRSQAVATSTIGDNGVSHFNSAQFTVDANGFVSLTASPASTIFMIDTSTSPGTNPVTPNGSSIVTITGGQVAAGTTTNVIRTDSLAANTYTIQIQRSQAVASSTIGDNGVSHFNSAYFTVDGNGFVSLNTAAIALTLTGNTGGALSPTAGNFNILGISTAAGTTPVTTAGSVSTLTIEVQKSQAIASTNATNVGLAAFNSTYFTVDANGFVSINGAAIGETITGNTGGALSPTAGNWNIVGSFVAAGTTPVSTSGTGSTLTINIQKSQAIASSNATEIGLAAFNSSQFSVDGNGFVSLTGSGSGFTSIVVQVFTSSGTYTPTSGMAYCIIEVIGGGGGGGGSAATSSIQVSGAVGGSSGGYAKSLFSAATVGASAAIVIGAGGTGGTAGGSSGGNGVAGGNTTIAIDGLMAYGGPGGFGATYFTNPATFFGNAGTSSTTSGNIVNMNCQNSTSAVLLPPTGGYGGVGGGGMYGTPGTPANSSGIISGPAVGYGCGGNGAFTPFSSSTGYVGSSGVAGAVIITEYIG